MQKKLIALAVAGMLAAPLAMAQSNVTIYGVFDIGLNYESSHATSGVKSRTALDSGQQSGSRLGFRGTEDLGNGLKASFVIEYGLRPDLNETLGTGGGATTRQSFLALSGDFGTVALGRQYTPQFNMIARMDPFGAGTAGNMANVYDWDTRLDNTVAYVSPNFSGLSVTVAHSMRAAGQELAKDAGNAKVWAISPRYSNGPIDVQLNMHRIKSDLSGSTATKVWDLAGSYDFGAVKAVAFYGSRKTNNVQDSRYWLLGATVPVSEAGSFKISYVASKDKEPASDVKENQWAIGYDHKLSARTNVYSAFAKRSQDWVGYKNQLTVGLRHMF
ncbi:MAG TPA: porin [Azoarcus taiwanensis]|nr:porin [Azoarcus taiwanensis]